MPEESKSLPDLALTYAPHIKDSQSVKKIMWFVVLALIPSNIFAIYIFDINTLALLCISVISAVTAEAIFQFLVKKPVSVLDGSAVITGLLVAMNMPPEIPVYVVAIGSIFAIIIVKQLFGGLGFNVFNPALSAKALIILLWPAYISAKLANATSVTVDWLPDTLFNSFTQNSALPIFLRIPELFNETPFLLDKIYDLLFSKAMINSIFLGNISGCIGEISPVLLLIGGLFLLFKRIITWHIPASYIGTVGLFMLIFYGVSGFLYPVKAVLFHLSSGSLLLGALFMATDMVSSPVTSKGMIFFGIGCGIITSVIRLWGAYPIDICCSILIMNAAVPLIDRFTRPRVFGT